MVFILVKKNGIHFFPLSKTLSLYRLHDSHKTVLGGIKRQEELLKIYEIYSPKYFKLYELLRNEKLKLTFFIKLVYFKNCMNS
jgi:hypothetical protein